MKVTQKQLQQLIKEELRKVLLEVAPEEPGVDVHEKGDPTMKITPRINAANAAILAGRVDDLETSIAALQGFVTMAQPWLQKQPGFTSPAVIPVAGSAEEARAKKIGRRTQEPK